MTGVDDLGKRERDVLAALVYEFISNGEPVGSRTLSRTLGAVLGALVGGLYLLNPTMGLIELIPDNVPVVGNLDEAGATLLVFYALRYLIRGPGAAGPWPPR